MPVLWPDHKPINPALADGSTTQPQLRTLILIKLAPAALSSGARVMTQTQKTGLAGKFATKASRTIALYLNYAKELMHEPKEAFNLSRGNKKDI